MTTREQFRLALLPLTVRAALVREQIDANIAEQTIHQELLDRRLDVPQPEREFRLHRLLELERRLEELNDELSRIDAERRDIEHQMILAGHPTGANEA